MTSTQAYPPVLAKAKGDDRRLNLEYLHQLGLANIKKLSGLKTSVGATAAVNLVAVMGIAVLLALVRRKVNGRLTMPRVVNPTTNDRDAENLRAVDFLKGEELNLFNLHIYFFYLFTIYLTEITSK